MTICLSLITNEFVRLLICCLSLNILFYSTELFISFYANTTYFFPRALFCLSIVLIFLPFSSFLRLNSFLRNTSFSFYFLPFILQVFQTSPRNRWDRCQNHVSHVLLIISIMLNTKHLKNAKFNTMLPNIPTAKMVNLQSLY